jgi:nucleotide-binding universal stress UspA family protein
MLYLESIASMLSEGGNEMAKCENVLLATDLSVAGEGAVNVAARLSDIYQVKVHIFHVFQYVPRHRYHFYVSWMAEEARQKTDRKLALVRAQIEEQGREIEICVVEDGDPARVILDYAKTLPNPIVVMGTHASAGIERFILGSVAEDVRRNVSGPVVTVGPEIHSSRRNRYTRLLVTIDQANVECVLEYATLLLDPIFGQIELLHVIADQEETTGAEECQIAHEYLCKKNVHPNAIRRQILHGTHIAQAIVNEAERSGTDLIVMRTKRAPEPATHMPPGIGTQVVSAAPCPVLSIPH